MKFTKLSERKYKVSRDVRGSNQHVRIIKVRRSPRIRAFVALTTLTAILGYAYVLPAYNNFANSFAPKTILSPMAQAEAEVMPTPTIPPTLTPTISQNQEVRGYIKEVFGKDADKAFQLLSCENSALNPDAVNTAGNYPEGSRDIGVFQINEYWQKVHAKFLFDPKINVQIAYKIFKDDGSFKMWSCGRRMGI